MNLKKQRGQTMVEFGLTFIVFFSSLIIAAGFGYYSLQRATAVAAASTAIRAASGGIVSPTNSIDLLSPDVEGSFTEARARIKPVMWSTKLVNYSPPSCAVYQSCSTPLCPILNTIPDGTVYICAWATPGSLSATACWPSNGSAAHSTPCNPGDLPENPKVDVIIRGKPANPVGSFFSVWPVLDVGASGIESVTFSR